MWNKLTYRNRNRVLLAGVVILLLVAWKFAFSRSFEVASQCNQLENSLAQEEQIAIRYQRIRNELKQIDKYLDSGSDKSISTHQKLLDKISNWCRSNALVLHEFPAEVTTVTEDMALMTSTAEVRGGFTDLVKLTDELERNFAEAKLTSVQYEVRKDRFTRKNQLYATLYFQHFQEV